ncbi:MAG: biotin--[acetyl-CoA-carboxylase] ligase [Phocaeicola sp.]
MVLHSVDVPQWLYKEEVDSTNRYLVELANCETLPHLYTVWADYQHAGRGQRENSWESEAGKNLTFSTLLYPKGIRANRQFLLSQSIAIAIESVLSTYVDGITIKWPNDIYHNNRKICGVLIEHDLQGSWVVRTVVGIGLNLNQGRFLSNAPNPVSLCQILGYPVNREKILKELLIKIGESLLWSSSSQFEKGLLNDTGEEKSSFCRKDRILLDESKSALSKEVSEEFNSEPSRESLFQLQRSYFQLQYRREGMHRFRDAQGEFSAQLMEILPDGHLILQDEAGVKRSYAFKEVSYL